MLDRRCMLRMSAPAVAMPLISVATALEAAAPLGRVNEKLETDHLLAKIISNAIDDFQPIANSGIALAVIKNKKLHYVGAFGLRDRRRSAKVHPDTFFPIGSATKAFTSMIVSLFAQEGKVALDQPIKNYLPDFNMKDGQVSNELDLEELLSQRTGLPRHDALWYLGPFTRAQLFYRLQYLDPVPGAYRGQFQYNNIMYMVAGYLLEALSGRNWEDLVKTRIFDKLKMPGSNFSIRDLTNKSDYAKPYEKNEELPIRDFSNIGPAAEINSNVLELANWVLLFLNGGKTPEGNEIIKQSYLEKMYHDYVNVGSGVGYGLGWCLFKIENKRFIYHPGDADGYTAYVSFLPDDGIGVIALTNQHCTSDLIGRWPDKVVARIYDYLLNKRVTGQIILPAPPELYSEYVKKTIEKREAATSAPLDRLIMMASSPTWGMAM